MAASWLAQHLTRSTAASMARDREQPAHLRDDTALCYAKAWPDPEARYDARSSHPGKIIDKGGGVALREEGRHVRGC
jgi:hypothetical protein